LSRTLRVCSLYIEQAWWCVTDNFGKLEASCMFYLICLNAILIFFFKKEVRHVTRRREVKNMQQFWSMFLTHHNNISSEQKWEQIKRDIFLERLFFLVIFDWIISYQLMVVDYKWNVSVKPRCLIRFTHEFTTFSKIFNSF